MFADATPEIAAKLIETALTTDDERARAVIGMGILDRVLGKASAMPQVADGGRTVDISQLTPEEMRELSLTLDTVFRLTGVGPGALPDG
jgi:hypothetical protein